MDIQTADLHNTFAVLSPDNAVSLVPNSATVYEDLDRDFGGFKGHELVAVHVFTADWPCWEMHPAGDEVVILLSGEVTFVIDDAGSHRSVHLQRPGSCVIVPRATWHTARVRVETRMLFITPGEGTQNRAL